MLHKHTIQWYIDRLDVQGSLEIAQREADPEQDEDLFEARNALAKALAALERLKARAN